MGGSIIVKIVLPNGVIDIFLKLAQFSFITVRAATGYCSLCSYGLSGDGGRREGVYLDVGPKKG